MGFWQRLTGKEQRDATSGLANPQGWMQDAFGASPSESGQRVTVKNALGIAPVWGAVSIISEQIGQLPLKVYRELDGERVEARDSRGWRMLHDKPNEFTPAGRFWATVTTHLLLWGNAFLLKLRDDMGLVEELFFLPPAEMSVKWDTGKRVKTFVHRPTDGRKETEYTVDDVLHVFGLSLDGVVGVSVITYCKNALGAALARDQYEGGFYRRGTTMSGVIEHPNRLGRDGLKNLKESFTVIYGGSDRAHQTAVLEEGATFKPMSSPLRDLMFVESQQLSRTDIAVMFKLPPNMLGGSTGDSLTYSTVEMNQQHLALHSLAPWTTTIAQALTWDPGVLPQRSFQAEFVLDALQRADSKTRADIYAQALDPAKGWMSRDEVRRKENLPPGEPPPPPQPTPGLGLPEVGPAPVPALNGNAPTTGD